jgi:hypothetical protein
MHPLLFKYVEGCSEEMEGNGCYFIKFIFIRNQFNKGFEKIQMFMARAKPTSKEEAYEISNQKKKEILQRTVCYCICSN